MATTKIVPLQRGVVYCVVDMSLKILTQMLPSASKNCMLYLSQSAIFDDNLKYYVSKDKAEKTNHSKSSYKKLFLDIVCINF